MKKKENQEEQNDHIYVVLVRALTGLGKLARLTGGYEYTHIAVCMDDKQNRFYTFSRRKHGAPFDCGYMEETLDCYAYGRHHAVKLKVFKIPVCRENKEQIGKYIEKVSKDPEYIFNLYSMLTMSFLHGFEIYKAHNCMSFAGKLLELADSVGMSKPYYRYDIKEIDELLDNYLYQEAFFEKETIETKDYMEHVGIIKNLLDFIQLNGILIYRLIAKRKGNDEKQF